MKNKHNAPFFLIGNKNKCIRLGAKGSKPKYIAEKENEKKKKIEK